ncbi:MAG: hypothetical protein WCA10_19155 [Terracidiphilus sp.]
MEHTPNHPEDLALLAANPRILVRRNGPPRPDGRCVVYWMQRANTYICQKSAKANSLL